MKNNRKRMKRKLRKLYIESRKCPKCGGYDTRWYIKSFGMCYFCQLEYNDVPY